MQVIYFTYSTQDVTPPIGAPGMALYARTIGDDYMTNDYKWDFTQEQWVTSDYLGYLATTGSPDLDNLDPADLPDTITKL